MPKNENKERNARFFMMLKLLCKKYSVEIHASCPDSNTAAMNSEVIFSIAAGTPDETTFRADLFDSEIPKINAIELPSVNNCDLENV